MTIQDELKKIEALKELVLNLLNHEIIPLQKKILAQKNNQNGQLEELHKKYKIASENFIPKYDELVRLCKRHGILVETTMIKYKTPLN